MRQLGVQSGADLKQLPLELLQYHFGKAALQYYNIARGQDYRSVNAQRIRKSMGTEITFEHDLSDPALMLDQLQQLLAKCLHKLSEKHQDAYTLTIKVKFDNFVQITRSRTLPHPLCNDDHSRYLLRELLNNAALQNQKIRLLGVTLSGLRELDGLCFRQLDLFELV